MSKHLNASRQREQGVFLGRQTMLFGSVAIGENTYILNNVVLRGDVNTVTVGKASNIQDGSLVATTLENPATIGNNVSVGMGAVLEGCTIEDNVLVGAGAIIEAGAVIGSQSIVSAGTVVPMNAQFPARSFIQGNPAQRVRDASEEEIKSIEATATRFTQMKTDQFTFVRSKRASMESSPERRSYAPRRTSSGEGYSSSSYGSSSRSSYGSGYGSGSSYTPRRSYDRTDSRTNDGSSYRSRDYRPRDSSSRDTY